MNVRDAFVQWEATNKLAHTTPLTTFTAAFVLGEKHANEKMKAMAATADLSGVKTILADFAERMKDSIAALAKTGPRDTLADVAAVYKKREDEGRDEATGVIPPEHVWHKFPDGSACAVPINPHPSPLNYNNAAEWSVARGKWSEERRNRENAHTPESDYAKRQREADVMKMTAEKGERYSRQVDIENIKQVMKHKGIHIDDLLHGQGVFLMPKTEKGQVGLEVTFADGSVWQRTK